MRWTRESTHSGPCLRRLSTFPTQHAPVSTILIRYFNIDIPAGPCLYFRQYIAFFFTHTHAHAMHKKHLPAYLTLDMCILLQHLQYIASPPLLRMSQPAQTHSHGSALRYRCPLCVVRTCTPRRTANACFDRTFPPDMSLAQRRNTASAAAREGDGGCGNVV